MRIGKLKELKERIRRMEEKLGTEEKENLNIFGAIQWKQVEERIRKLEEKLVGMKELDEEKSRRELEHMKKRLGSLEK